MLKLIKERFNVFLKRNSSFEDGNIKDVLEQSDAFNYPFRSGRNDFQGIFPWGIEITINHDHRDKVVADKDYREANRSMFKVYSDERIDIGYPCVLRDITKKTGLSEEFTRLHGEICVNQQDDVFELNTRLSTGRGTIVLASDINSPGILAFSKIIDMQKRGSKHNRFITDLSGGLFDTRDKEAVTLLRPATFLPPYMVIPGGEKSFSYVESKMKFLTRIFNTFKPEQGAVIQPCIIDKESFTLFIEMCNRLDEEYTEFLSKHNNPPSLEEVESFQERLHESSLDLVMSSDIRSNLYALKCSLDSKKREGDYYQEDVSWAKIKDDNNKMRGASCIRHCRDAFLYFDGINQDDRYMMTVPKSFRNNEFIDSDIKELIGDTGDMSLATKYSRELTNYLESRTSRLKERVELKDFYQYYFEKSVEDIYESILATVRDRNTMGNPAEAKIMPYKNDLIDFIQFCLLELANNPEGYSSSIEDKYKELNLDIGNFSLNDIIYNTIFRDFVVADQFNVHDNRWAERYLGYGLEYLKGVYFRNPLLLFAIKKITNKEYMSTHRDRKQVERKEIFMTRNIMKCGNCSTMHGPLYIGNCVKCGAANLEGVTLEYKKERAD